ncbi:polysaccharide biosynthesis C-terminal domain-containing protein [Pseudoruegeria sp. SK021]|uniref:polysaccharide biosynthesis C-terminal domain-containing protein n=1 Tax=Pseudoruegeria sp. SK021 TaxID=1933035 RepID=UPI001F0AE50B
MRLIGAESFGTYAYVIAWTTVLGYISTLGFHVSLLRLLPTYQVDADWPKAGGVIRFTFVGTAIAGTVVATAAAGLAFLFYGVGSELGRALLIGTVIVPFLALRLVSAAAVRAFGGVIAAMLPERILRDTLAFAFLSLAVVSGIGSPNAITAILAALAGALVMLWVLHRFLSQRRPSELAAAPRLYAPMDWLRPAIPLTVIMLADTLMSRTGIIVLGTLGEPTEIAIFAVASSLALLAALPRMSISALFAPTVSTLYARGDTGGLQDLIGRSALLSLLGTIAVAGPLIFGAPIILAWFGQEFIAAKHILIVLVFGQIVAAAAGPQQHLLTMTGHEREGAMLMITAAATNVIAAILLYFVFGMMGVAVAFSFSLIAWNVGIMWFLKRRLNLRPGLTCVPFLTRRAASTAAGDLAHPPQEQGQT